MGIDKVEQMRRSGPKRRSASSAEPSQLTGSALHPSGEMSTLCASMYALLTSDTGWLRIVPADGDLVYVKWKWDGGAHKGYYVMTRGQLEELPFLLETLLRKREEVERGERSATKDRYYGQQT